MPLVQFELRIVSLVCGSRSSRGSRTSCNHRAKYGSRAISTSVEKCRMQEPGSKNSNHLINFHTGVCLQRPEEQSLKKCPKVSSAPTLCYFFVSSELSPLYQRAALVFLFCLGARYEPDALALFLALSLLRCLAMSCAVRAVVRCPALLLSALSLQLLCSALLCASCAVHCFRAVALLLFFFFFFFS